MKIIKDILCTLFGVALFGVLAWSLLYLCIPDIKDGTNKLFKWGDYATVEEDKGTDEDNESDITIAPNPDKEAEADSSATPTSFKFENEHIAIIVG